MPDQLSAGARRRLLAWFDRNARPLPWRADRDPYRIWVSEVMLQQTTVAAIVPRFDQFLHQFPNLQALADASEHDVLKAWQGLGYYSRARNLHRAARILVNEHGGALPDDPAVWLELPGVGRYIAGAVLSQAFDRRLPIIEANTKRVLCRLYARRGDPKSTAMQKWLWTTAEAILPRKRVGDFNQALMELGATVCTIARPNCERCPLRGECLARERGLQSKIPSRPRPPETVEVREVCLVAKHRGHVLIVRRPAGGRWANMWEFPTTELGAGESGESGARRMIDELGLSGEPRSMARVVRYAVTRFRMSMSCFEVKCRRSTSKTGHWAESRWVQPAALPDYALSTSQRTVADSLDVP